MFRILTASFLLCFSVPALLRAEEFKEATFVKAARGVVTFEANGSTHELYVAPTIKGFDDMNNALDGPFVARLFVPGNILAIKTGKVAGKEMITEVRLVKGKVAEMKADEKANINPKDAPLSSAVGSMG